MTSKCNVWIVMCNLLFVCDALIENPFDVLINYFRPKRQVESSGCTLPPHPEHGRWTLLNGKANPGDKALPSSVILFECEHGYKLTSKFPAVCLKEWSAPIPECEELCPPLYHSNVYDLRCVNKVGEEVNCSEASHGTNLEYICKTYYETPFGYKKTLFCENGKWDHPRPVCQPECGKKILNDAKPAIYGGESSETIIHPWVAAIYKKINSKDGYEYENICGGSILSQTVILTAAHCVTNNYGDVLAKEDYMVGVGKVYRTYQAPQDKQAQYIELSKIIVPDEYRADTRKFSSDIAILVVKGEIVLKRVVQPVCFYNMKNIRLRAGSKGEISGWGVTNGSVPSEILRTLVIPYKYETVCADELPSDWADKYYLKDKICAGFINQSMGVCTGDSGGGLAFKYGEDNRYYIHGLVSLSHQVDYMCNIQQNALYTSVASHYEFVDRLLTKYAPKIRDCVLPSYPENGKWTTEEGDLKPGDAVPSDTVLKFQCSKGFILSSTKSIACGAAHNLPTCDMLCPEPKLPNGAYILCGNRENQQIACSSATDGSNMWYGCPFRYTEAGSFNRTCNKGSWGLPKPECVRDCGETIVDDSGIGSEYPWSVGIYKIINAVQKKYKYICGGSIVSDYAVVTAAQCVTDESGHLLPKDDYLIVAGKGHRRFNSSTDMETQILNITFINISPKYVGTGKEFYNIAILIAYTNFQLNNFVQPICISELTDIWWQNGDKAMMIGKFTKDDTPEIVDALEVKDLSSNTCVVPSYFHSLYFTAESINMCFGFKNESVCLLPEDSGNGIVSKYPENGRFYLHAIVTYYEDMGCMKNFWNANVSAYSNAIYCATTDI